MKNRHACIIGAVLALALSGVCQEVLLPPPGMPAPGSAQPPEPSAAETEAQPVSGLRDPFWPPGYRPKPKHVKSAVSAARQTPEALPKVEKQAVWPNLPLKGIIRTSRGAYGAILEGVGAVESGDIVAVRREGFLFRWKVDAVTRDGVSITKLDATSTSD